MLAMPWEIGSCISERLIPVVQYLRQNQRYAQTPILISDVSIKHAKQLPAQFEVIPTDDTLIKIHCRKEVLLLVSPTSTLYTRIMNYLHPNQWRAIQEIHSINNERWTLYKAICR